MFPTGFPQPRSKDVGKEGWHELADLTLLSNLAANTMLTFTGFTGHRLIKIAFSTQSASTVDDIRIRINGDISNIYSYTALAGASVTSGTALASIPLPGAAATSVNGPTIGYMEFINEKSTPKEVIAFYTNIAATASTVPTALKVHGVYYGNQNAINDINIFTTTNPLQAGSRFTIYGIE